MSANKAAVVYDSLRYGLLPSMILSISSCRVALKSKQKVVGYFYHSHTSTASVDPSDLAVPLCSL